MAKEEARFGEERVVRVVLARDGRGRPSERRCGVCVVILLLSFPSLFHSLYIYKIHTYYFYYLHF